MKKKIRQITGTSIGVTFTKEEQESRGIEVGGWVDLSDAIYHTKDGLVSCDIVKRWSWNNTLPENRYLDKLIKDAIKQHEETKHE